MKRHKTVCSSGDEQRFTRTGDKHRPKLFAFPQAHHTDVLSQFTLIWHIINQSTLQMTYLNIGGQRWNHNAQNQDR